MSDPRTELREAVGLPAITCAVAGLILPLAQIPAVFLTAIFGRAALFIVPAAIFGAMLAFGIARGDADRTRRCMRFTALGFAGGALLSSFLLGPATTPGFLAALLTGAAGGFCLSFGCVDETPARLLITAATAVSFALVALIGFGGSASGCGG